MISCYWMPTAWQMVSPRFRPLSKGTSFPHFCNPQHGDRMEMFPGRRRSGAIFYNEVKMSGIVSQIHRPLGYFTTRKNRYRSNKITGWCIRYMNSECRPRNCMDRPRGWRGKGEWGKRLRLEG